MYEKTTQSYAGLAVLRKSTFRFKMFRLQEHSEARNYILIFTIKTAVYLG